MTANTSGDSIPEVQFEYHYDRAEVIKWFYRKCYHWKTIMGFYFVIAVIPHALFGFIESWMMYLDENDIPGIYDKVMSVWQTVLPVWIVFASIAAPILIQLYIRFQTSDRTGRGECFTNIATVSPQRFHLATTINDHPMTYEITGRIQIQINEDSCVIMQDGQLNQYKMLIAFITDEDWQRIELMSKQCSEVNSDSIDL